MSESKAQQQALSRVQREYRVHQNQLKLVIGNLATNYVTVRVEEKVRIREISNRMGRTVVLASGRTNLGKRQDQP